MFKTCCMIAAAALLAACGASKPREQSAPAGIEAPVSVRPPAGPGVYRIDSAQSELRLLVHRAGPMARLGHNHVIVNRTLGGWVRFTGNVAAAAFSISVPVAEFVVDDTSTRQAEGDDFSEEVSADAKAGTRRNMLGAALLDAEHFPVIELASVAVTQTAGTLTATLAVEVAGHRSTLVVPFDLDASGARLAASGARVAASGTAIVRQSALGLTPFSVMLGALQVQDELTVKFKLVATSP